MCLCRRRSPTSRETPNHRYASLNYTLDVDPAHARNAVAPGFVRTDLTRGGRGAGDWQATEERFAAKAMMGRIGEPEDIANAIAFLASPESGWITAQMLTVDGGRMDYIGHG